MSGGERTVVKRKNTTNRKDRLKTEGWC